MSMFADISILNLQIPVVGFIIFLVVFAGLLLIIFLAITFYLIKTKLAVKSNQWINDYKKEQSWSGSISDFEAEIAAAAKMYKQQSIHT